MKKTLNTFLLGLFLSGSAIAGDVHTTNIVFINCTKQEINVANSTSPYKFSLDPNFRAVEGYSPPYSFTIPANPVYKHKKLTMYHNEMAVYCDASMNVVFSGGINAQIKFVETRGGAMGKLNRCLQRFQF